jgi:16S rRNA (cytidine1402-2'-O)-methyltransferase
MARPAPADDGPSGRARATLYIVATPIGNLEDITLRALRVLGDVDLVAAEDTRRTGNLLRHYAIGTRLISLHRHNEGLRLPDLLARLGAGASIAVVTDAGTPGISDPGAQLVAAARAGGFRVEPIPGPSAVAAALSVSGLSAERFAFLGFPPTRSKDRQQFFERVVGLPDFAVVFFEAPHRVTRTLEELGGLLVNRPITIGRELTKAHEELIHGTPAEAAARLESPRGELTIVVSPVTEAGRGGDSVKSEVSDTHIGSVFGEITKNNTSTRREAIREAARQTGLSVKEVYLALERLKDDTPIG